MNDTSTTLDDKVLIGFTGVSQSGKDTAARVLVDKLNFKRIAFADPLRDALFALNPLIPSQFHSNQTVRLREIVTAFGWDFAKTKYPEVRQLLQRVGTEVGRELFGENFWVDRAMDQIGDAERVVFTDVRFDNEAEAILNAGGIVLKIVRPGVAAVNNHKSDAGISEHLITAVIANDGTIGELQMRVEAVANFELGDVNVMGKIFN